MAINKKLIFWNNQSNFSPPTSSTDTTKSVLWQSIVFFNDTKKIWTHGVYFSSPLDTLLSGYSVGTNTALAASDTILGAFGKIQAQLNAKQVSLPDIPDLAGTYTKVTVSAKGLVTAGSNPTTLSGYGITDAYTKTQINGFLYTDTRTITPTTWGAGSMQFGFTSKTLNNVGNWADFIRFGGYMDSTGGRENIILFFKDGFGLRQYQGDFDSASYNHGYVDYWHSGNFNPSSYLTTATAASTYLPLSGGILTGRLYTRTIGTYSHDGAIEIGERDGVGAGQSSWSYAPRIAFHWGGRYVKAFGMRSDGQFAIADTDILIHSGNIGSQSVNYAASAGNADTLDSLHAVNFTRSADMINSGDWNTISLTGDNGSFGARVESGTANPPAVGVYNWSLWQQGTSTRGSQLALGAYGGNRMFFRGANLDTGSFRGWAEVWHTGNLPITLSNGYLPYWNGSGLVNSNIINSTNGVQIPSGGYRGTWSYSYPNGMVISAEGTDILIDSGWNAKIILKTGSSGYENGLVYIPYGKVGIGYTDRSEKFAVNGSGYFNTTLEVAGITSLGGILGVTPGRGAAHLVLTGTDADYGVARIIHTSTAGSGTPGTYTATLALIDQRLNNLSGAYEPNLFINVTGAQTIVDLMRADVRGSTMFRLTQSGAATFASSVSATSFTENGVSISNKYLQVSPDSQSPRSGNFAIGSYNSRNFIQSHNGQPLDINPLGNAVTINGYTPITSNNISSQSVTYATNSTRLYASDAPYTWGGSAPYYLYMNYDGGSYWELKVSPATPGQVRVGYSNTSGVSSYTNNINTGASIQGGAGWSYLRFQTNNSLWDIGKYDSQGNDLQFRWGGGETKITMSSDAILHAYGFKGNANIGGTGEAIWCPSGIYSGSTQWLYGTSYHNNAAIYDVGLLSMTGAIALNDNKLYLRTNGDGNHYLWNASDDWEEWVFYGGTGLRITSSTVGSVATINNSGITTSNLYSSFLSSSQIATTQGIGDDTSGVRIVNPGGGSYYSQTVGLQGAIKIKLPVKNSATMMRFTVKIYEYSTALSRTIEISGYNYSGGGWYNLSATQTTQSAGNITIRFGEDGTSDCVWIGETSMVWAYPQVFITDFQGGYSNVSRSTWTTGWNISFVTAFDSVETSTVAYTSMHAGNYNSYAMAGAGYSANQNLNTSNSPTFAYLSLTNSESLGVYGVRGKFTGEAMHLYNKVNIGDPRGWGYYSTSTPNYGLSVYGQIMSGYGDYSGLIVYGHQHIYGSGHLYLDSNYGQSIVGLYTSTRYQGVFAMGDSYKLPIDGTSPGNLYGLAWSHPNAGGVASNLNTHGLLVMENGTFLAAISGSIRARDDVRAPALYDSGSRVAISRGEGRNYVDYAYGLYDAYRGGWRTSNDLYVAYAYSAGNAATADKLNGYGSNPNNSHPGHGLRAFYSWNAGQAYNDSSGYSNGITIGSHSSDTNYGFQIVQNMWDDRLYFRRYDYGWKSWLTVIDSATIGSQSVNYATSAGSTSYASNSGGLNGWSYTAYAYRSSGTSGYYQINDWIQLNGVYGLYCPGTNGAHFLPNTASSYGTWRMVGSRNSYSGIHDDYSAVTIGMLDSGGNGGFYRQAQGRWYFYYHLSNACMSINTSTTSTSYGLYVSGGIYSTGNVVAYSDIRKKENIITVENALDKVLKLRGVFYNKKDDNSKTRQLGVIAQEVQEILPEVVTYAYDIDEYGVSYGNFAGLFIQAIKEQQLIIEKQANEIENLKQLILK